MQFDVPLGGLPVHVISKPGIPHWDRVTSASQLLADHVRLNPADKVLLLGCGHGALAVCLARLIPQGWLKAVDTSLVSVRLTAMTLEANSIKNAQACDQYPILSENPGGFDHVIMELPKGRKLVRRWLVEAYTSLKTGGSLYMAGPNQEGIQPAIKDAAELFGNSRLLNYKKNSRVARFINQERYVPANYHPSWASEPGILPGTWHTFQKVIRGKEYTIHSLPGVFSFDELDQGTSFLLENLQVPAGVRVLDFGCGYGIIGLVASALGAGQVDLVDASLLAVASAKENIQLNKMEGLSAFPADGLTWADDHSYDLLVSNPPFHSGKEVDFDIVESFIEQSRRVINPGGRLVLVANRFLRYDQKMRASLGNVEIIAQTNRFQVLSSLNQP